MIQQTGPIWIYQYTNRRTAAIALLRWMLVAALAFLVSSSFAIATFTVQNAGITDFEVRENLLKNGKLAVIAVDAEGTPQEQINGVYQFSMNGFQQELRFHDGVGIAPQPIESSIFVFIKHRNEVGSNGKLYYVLKNDQGLRPIYIPWYTLILVPLLVLLVAYVFKRLLILAVFLLIGLFIYNYSKGLNLERFLDTIVHGLKGLGGS